MDGKFMAHNALAMARKMSSQNNMTMACEGFVATYGRAIPRAEFGYYTNCIYFDKVFCFQKS